MKKYTRRINKYLKSKIKPELNFKIGQIWKETIHDESPFIADKHIYSTVLGIKDNWILYIEHDHPSYHCAEKARHMYNRCELQTPVQIEYRFNELRKHWINYIKSQPISDHKYNHHSYQEIIAFGITALPLIYKDWETSDIYWFNALESIVGVSPVKPEHLGQFKKIKQDWLDYYNNK